LGASVDQTDARYAFDTEAGMELQFDHELYISCYGFAEYFLDRNASEASNPGLRTSAASRMQTRDL
jgi:hypothetical protein